MRIGVGVPPHGVFHEHSIQFEMPCNLLQGVHNQVGWKGGQCGMERGLGMATMGSRCKIQWPQYYRFFMDRPKYMAMKWEFYLGTIQSAFKSALQRFIYSIFPIYIPIYLCQDLALPGQWWLGCCYQNSSWHGVIFALGCGCPSSQGAFVFQQHWFPSPIYLLIVGYCWVLFFAWGGLLVAPWVNSTKRGGWDSFHDAPWHHFRGDELGRIQSQVGHGYGPCSSASPGCHGGLKSSGLFHMGRRMDVQCFVHFSLRSWVSKFDDDSVKEVWK